MSDHMDDELSRAEGRAFDALPREKNPPRHLEDRVVAALRARGTLPTPLTVARSRRTGGMKFWIPAAAAAAVAIFASGFAFGQLVGTSRGVDLAVRVGSQVSATEAAARLESIGSRYVEALAALSQQASDTSNTAVRDSVRTVAIRVLGQAAEEMALIAPDDPLAAAVLRGMNQRNRVGQPAAPSRNVVWY